VFERRGGTSGAATDSSAVLDGAGAGDTGSRPSDTATVPDGQQPPSKDIGFEFPTPPSTTVVLDNGTYAWSAGERKLSFAVNGDTVLLLESSFDCSGETGCKILQDVSKLTCNQAWEKNYSAQVNNNTFVIEGIKTSDRLTGILWDNSTVRFVYQLTPPVSCCDKTFSGDAVWASKDDCDDYLQTDCDPYTDQECKPGENCIFDNSGKPACFPAGEKAIGEVCSVQSQCSDGVCMATASVSEQHCFKLCAQDVDCGAGLQCMGMNGKKWKICSLKPDQYETCNILTQDCSEPGDACYWAASPINQPICLPAGTAGKKEACETSSDCQKGFDCLAAGKCYQICDTNGGDPACESPFTSCPDHYPPQHAGYCDE